MQEVLVKIRLRWILFGMMALAVAARLSREYRMHSGRN